MTPTPYLFFNGNCRDAIETYAKIFGGTIEALMPATEMPAEYPVPDDRKNWIMHCTLVFDGGRLMASDSLYETSDKMAGSSVMMVFPTNDAGKRAFDALADGGEITMAYEPTFWTAGFGTLTDRFGVRWMISTDEAPAA